MKKMNMPIERWYKAIQTRRSRRTFIAKAIEETSIEALKDHITQLNLLYDGVRLKLVEHSPNELFVGAVGPYGKITGAPAYIAVVTDEKQKHRFQLGGILGEAIVLEATALGLSTCWIGGFFQHERASLEVAVQKGENVIAILPLGHARKNFSLTEKMMHQSKNFHKRKSLNDLVEGLSIEQWPPWMERAIHVAILAPSAYNRQPLRYYIDDDHSITISVEDSTVETNVPKEIDCGIAMLHIELAARFHNIDGDWEYMDYPKLVEFKPGEAI